MPFLIKLNAVRCSFLTLGEPEYYQGKKQRPDDQPRWSATGLIPYDSPMIKLINDTMLACAIEKWDKKGQQVYDAFYGDTKLSCFTDGKRKAYDGYAGHWALVAHRKLKDGRPLVMDSDKSPIYFGKSAPGGDGAGPNDMYPGKAGRVYSGCFVNLQVNFWAQNNNNGKAVRAELVGIQRVKDGDAFSGGVAPDEDSFDEITEGNAADDLV